MEIVPVSLNEVVTGATHGATDRFDPAASPLHGRAVFLVGSPRSGTTWLHQLLAVHPSIATSGESHVLCEGLGTLFENHDDADPYMNLSTWVSRAELVGLARQLVDGLFLTVRDRARPGATHVLDKTPDHRPHAALLGEVYPDASFIHIIRDGRDVAASAHDLWAGWGGTYRRIDGAAAVWADAVTDIRRHLSGLRYHEVRYEDLVADPARELTAVLDAIGLPHDRAFVEAAVSFGQAPINVRPSDTRVGARKWDDLAPDAERAIVATAGDLLVELGYLDEGQRARALAVRTPAIVRRDVAVAARRLAAAARRRSRRFVEGRRRRAQVEQVEEVRRAGRRLANALTTGEGEVAPLLVRHVRLEGHDGMVEVGRDAVERSLLATRGWRVVAVDADRRACGVQLVGGDGQRRLHRYFVTRGTITRIVVQGA